ncbi:MAG: TlpA disulfide reductase family protein [Myxococcota bacterium]
MARAPALSVLCLLVGCATAGTTANTTATPGEPVAAADPAPQPDPAPAAEPGADSLAAQAPAEEPPPAEEPATEPSNPEQGEPPAAEPEPEPAKDPTAATKTLELPRPLHAGTNDKCGKDPGVGQPLKAFSLPTPKGKTINKGTYRGRVLVVNFWGTWCKPCLKELPEFDQLYRRYRKHGMTLLAIATDEDAEAVADLVAKRKIAAKIAIAGEDYAGTYGSPKFPFTFIVDYKGVIQASYRGYKPECMGQLEADIREQLEVRADAKARRAKK